MESIMPVKPEGFRMLMPEGKELFVRRLYPQPCFPPRFSHHHASFRLARLRWLVDLAVVAFLTIWWLVDTFPCCIYAPVVSRRKAGF